ncbi:hypothetical protein LPJ66_006952 [Kickxella alabastrina]|uniref:Uncharacterized protein n=1 Tax=Kickxella alabastrina TaxID=61397 RepID=A0ACC1IDY6_9FUNG|nr:hypothetical protein LPJ66_006952 [Kickxella alabastrina]
MRPQLFASLLTIMATSYADIVLSVAPANNMNDYLSVLSSAWPKLQPQLNNHLKLAQEQVPAEYSYLLKLLSVTAVPTKYDSEWAHNFVNNAQKIGPTTILADEIPGADNGEEFKPTRVVSTYAGSVATVDVPVARPTIVVAINGNAARVMHNAETVSLTKGVGKSSESDDDDESEEENDSLGEEEEVESESSNSGKRSSSSSTSGADGSVWDVSRVSKAVLISAAVSLSTLF